MKHWDLTPGETVVLTRGDTRRTVELVFRGRDTIHAFFSFGLAGDWIELDLSNDGFFRDAAGRCWNAEGTAPDTKIVIEEPTGEGPRFTRALKQRIRKATA